MKTKTLLCLVLMLGLPYVSKASDFLESIPMGEQSVRTYLTNRVKSFSAMLLRDPDDWVLRMGVYKYSQDMGPLEKVGQPILDSFGASSLQRTDGGLSFKIELTAWDDLTNFVLVHDTVYTLQTNAEGKFYVPPEALKCNFQLPQLCPFPYKGAEWVTVDAGSSGYVDSRRPSDRGDVGVERDSVLIASYILTNQWDSGEITIYAAGVTNRYSLSTGQWLNKPIRLSLTRQPISAAAKKLHAQSLQSSRISLTGSANQIVTLESSTDLSNWEPLGLTEFSPYGECSFEDGSEGVQRFYRARYGY